MEIVISKELFSMLGFSKSGVVKAIKEFSVFGLYLERRISAGKAVQLMGIRKGEFVRLLARKHTPRFDYTDEELEEESCTLQLVKG